MDKYSAIMAAADFIERNPERYSYMQVDAPCKDGDGRGCMIGWIGTFMGMEKQFAGDIMEKVTGKRAWMPDTAFGIDMGQNKYLGHTRDPKIAAEMMREFAKQFSPAEIAQPIAKPFEPAYVSWRSRLLKPAAIAASLLLCAVARAGTTNLPDPNVIVNPNYNNNTTIVSFTSGIQVLKTYRGPSRFYYFAPCAKPDSPTYRCTVQSENGVVIVAPDGSTAVVNLTVQFAYLLNRSGHNFWVSQQIILAGDVTTTP